MRGFIFILGGMLIVRIIYLLFSCIFRRRKKEISRLTPIERGFAVVGKVHGLFSLQYFVILVLFLCFDLEIVFVVRLVLSGVQRIVIGIFFFLFIIGGLWVEWAWGKLIWVL